MRLGKQQVQKFYLVILLVLFGIRSSADLIDPVETTDNADEFDGCIYDTEEGATAIDPIFSSTSWRIAVSENPATNTIRVYVRHLVAPHPSLGETAPNPPAPAWLTADLLGVDPEQGTTSSTLPVERCLAHGNSHTDCLQVRYDPAIGGGAEISIRVEHLTGFGVVPLDGPLRCSRQVTAIPTLGKWPLVALAILLLATAIILTRHREAKRK